MNTYSLHTSTYNTLFSLIRTTVFVSSASILKGLVPQNAFELRFKILGLENHTLVICAILEYV